MKLGNFVKSISPFEIVLFIAFILYIVIPVQLPDLIRQYADGPISMIILFGIVVYLFLYTNPALGILGIFVAYELLRRSADPIGRAAYIQYTPTEIKREADLKEMNPPKPPTLEEEVVDKMAPIGHSDPASFVDTEFKPIADGTHNALTVKR